MMDAQLVASTGPHMMEPDGEARLRELEFLVGAWECEGSAADSHLGPGHGIRSTFTMERLLGGHWYQLRCVELPTPENPRPISVTNHWGWDRARGELVRTFHASTGAWGVARSAGLKDDELVWLGEMTQADGARMTFRQTVTKVDARRVLEKMEVFVDGRWILRGTLVCQRRVGRGGTPPGERSW